MEVGGGSDVPGVTSEGTRAKAARIIGEVSDDHFNDLRGKPGKWGRARRRRPRGTPGTYPPDSGPAPIPDPLGE